MYAGREILGQSLRNLNDSLHGARFMILLLEIRVVVTQIHNLSDPSNAPRFVNHTR